MSDSHPNDHITTPGGAGHSHDITIPGGPGGTPLQFTEEQWQQFRDSDLAAARAVVLLMGCIFTIGLLMYSSINWLIW
jgi:hypothetical protein